MTLSHVDTYTTLSIMQRIRLRWDSRYATIFRLWMLFVLLVMLGLLYYDNYVTDMGQCYQENLREVDYDSELKLLPHILLLEEPPVKNEAIFFHETSCKRRRSGLAYFYGEPGKNIAQLSVMQACAVEAAALHNPQRHVYVLFAHVAYSSGRTLSPQLHALQRYPNVHLVNAPVYSYASGTPAERLLSARADGHFLWASRNLPKKLERFLLCVTLWRWGGLVMDLDTLTLRSLDGLPATYVWLKAHGGKIQDHVPNAFQLSLDVNGTDEARALFDSFIEGYLADGVALKDKESLLNLWLASMCSLGPAGQSKKLFNLSCNGVADLPSTELFAVLDVDHLIGYFIKDELFDAMNYMVDKSNFVEFWKGATLMRDFRLTPHLLLNAMAEKHCPEVLKLPPN